jgi:hypothetical protein
VFPSSLNVPVMRCEKPGDSLHIFHTPPSRPLRSNGTINNGKKAEWPVEQVDGLVMQTDIRLYCLLSSSLSLEPTRLNPPVKPKEIFAMAAKFPYRCLSFHYSSEAKKCCSSHEAQQESDFFNSLESYATVDITFVHVCPPSVV